MTNFSHIVSDEDIIRYADIMIINSDAKGILNKQCLHLTDAFIETPPTGVLGDLRKELISKIPTTDGSFDVLNKFGQSNYDRIYKHLQDYEYITPLDNTLDWKLSEVGKFVKRIKGHDKYVSYLEKKIDSEIAEMNGKIDWRGRVLFTAIVAFASGIIITILAILLKSLLETQQCTH